jgi:hypothetical protein
MVCQYSLPFDSKKESIAEGDKQPIKHSLHEIISFDKQRHKA